VKKLRENQLQALRYYRMVEIPPGDPRKIHHPTNVGWSTATIQWALEHDYITVGPGGWHVITPLGLSALSEAERVRAAS